ncbi:MAG: bifunctional phosphopantothenoylcysteine decarboxylase/phosphopantothenate--cysteine ligase CoaBC [Desulfovibrio sp.]|nr:bifunctional phosphopantothenoylcysteine decarboxylase/phosphopantothenate--cysteine ligase CoaBC [Desulfovibrio sp.]
MSASGVNPFVNQEIFANKKVHLGVCGSVACYKAAELLRLLRKIGVSVSVTLTEAAKKFISPALFASLGADPVYDKLFDDEDIFAHLRPGQAADAFVVAPATANILAKMTAGIADDTLSCQLLAYNKPVLIAPAMNPRMLAHPATKANIRLLHQRGYRIIESAEGETACGESGKGRLAEIEEIFLNILKALSPKDLSGKKVLVTLGPTREYWDGVRFISNPSSGKMGAALATAAWLRGAFVTAIVGPCADIFLPAGVYKLEVESAEEMLAEAEAAWPDADYGIFSAAVCDFAPEERMTNEKIPKSAAPSAIKIKRTPDIIGTLAAGKSAEQKVLGFAAQIAASDDELRDLALAKLRAKNMDLIAANRVDGEEGAFGADESALLVWDQSGRTESWPRQSKAASAWDLCSWLLEI